MTAITATSGAGRLAVGAAYDGSLIEELPLDDLAAVEGALSDAARLFHDRDGWLTIEQRVNIFRRAAEIMRERTEALTLQAAREGGKPYVDSLIEVERAIDGLDVCIEMMRGESGEVIQWASTARPRAGWRSRGASRSAWWWRSAPSTTRST